MKKTLIVVVALLVVVVAALFVAPAFIPVDTYKDQIETAALDATGRELKINGDISLSLLPRLAVEAEDVTFANAPGASEPQMASIEKLAVQLQIWPLLQREVKLDRLVLIGPRISLEVDAEGRPNWAFESAGGESAASESAAESAGSEASDGGASPGLSNVALGEVRLEGGQVSYRDAASGAAHAAEDINMDVSLPSLDSPLKAEGGLVWNGKKVSLNLDADRPRAFLEGGRSSLVLKIDSQHVALSYDGNVGLGQQVKMGGLVDLNVPSIRELAAWAGAPIEMAGEGLGPMSIKGELSATPSVFSFSNAEIGFDGMTGNGAVTADVSGAKPYIKAELNLDVLDVNKYMPPEAEAPAETESADAGDDKAQDSGPQEWSDEPIDLSGLHAVNADFALSVKGIRVRKIVVEESALDVAIKDGLLTADLKQLKLYQGQGRAELSLDGRGDTPRIQQSFSLQGIDAGAFLTDAADFDRLEGGGDIDLSVTAAGKSQKAMVQTLGGKGSIKFADGAIRGINLAQMVRNVATAFTDSGEAQKTDFAELSATFTITKGIFDNKDLLLLNPLLRVSGAGTSDLPQRTVNYRVEPKLVATTEGQGGDAAAKGLAVPVIAEGPWHDITYRPDLAAAIGGSVQDIAKDPEQAIEGAKDLGKNLLKGLTGQGGSEAPAEAPAAEGEKESLPDPAGALKKLFGD